MLGVLILVALQGQDFPSPPFVREWTFRMPWMTRPVIDDATAFFSSDKKCVAFDLRNRKVVWEWASTSDDSPRSMTITESTIYVSTELFRSTADARLIAFDRRTGEEQWVLTRHGNSSDVVVHDGMLYTVMEPGQLAAIDLEDRTTVWITDLRQNLESDDDRIAMDKLSQVSGGHIFAAVTRNQTVSIDIETGEIEWRVGDSYSFDATPVVHDGAVLFNTNQGMEARDTASGETLWTKDYGVPWFSAVFGGRVLMLADGMVRAVEARTGEVAWSYIAGEQGVIGGWNQEGYVSAERAVLETSAETICFDTEGKVLWSLPADPTLPAPIWIDEDLYVSYDSPHIMGYRQGTYPPLPTETEERKELARSMMAEFELLDEFEIKRLISLGDDAFEAVLSEYVKRADHFESIEFEEDIDKQVSHLNDVLWDIDDIFADVFSEPRTADLIEEINKRPTGHTARTTMVELVSKKGDPVLSAVFLLAKLTAVPPESLELRGEMRNGLYAIAKSHDPPAVEFMISMLENPEVDDSIRQLAYRNLARTGGQAGLEAVLAERRSRELLPPLLERMRLDQLKLPDERFARRILYDQKTDDKGRSWLLFTHNALGDSTDLWIVEKTSEGFGRPLFTDAHTFDESPGALSEIRSESERFYGKTAKELLDGAWFELFVDNEEIERDSDGDGLTDLIEKRLGTDPKNADTDGDGDSDSVDPWPNTAPRELSDEEQVLAAVFEARYHFSGPATPGIMSSKKFEPFEMPGRTGWVMWRREDDTSRRLSDLGRSYGRGMASISFHETREYDEEHNALPGTGKTINWNEDRTEATVTISTYWGGLAGDGTMGRVRKFGDEWVVVEMQLRYVS